MEAALRLPMVSFELKASTEPVSFGTKLKQYIAGFYREDPETYNNEIRQLEQLRSAAVRPSTDVTGVQILKKYYCQLKFLKSRFPLEKNQQCVCTFSWKDTYAGVACSVADIDFELMSILFNIGALHSQLGAGSERQSAEGMKMACTHFQCAAWAFQQVREVYAQQVAISLASEVVHFMELSCLAQAQECILEKSMTDGRKCTIIAKVAAQAADYYQKSGGVLTGTDAQNDVGEVIGGKIVKDWSRYLRFKNAYHSCVSLLYQGQQSEEQQKMGERVALYQASSDRLEEARKIAGSNASKMTALPQHTHAEIEEALAFTQDVVEGKKKAARNENEFIYHETVPEKDALPVLQGASLVRPVPFGINDLDVSGSDIFNRLVPMEAHEASSIYSEKKADLLRRTSAAVEKWDQDLDTFMNSLHHIEYLTERLGTPEIVPQEVIDRAAALNARPQAAQQLIDAMNRLSTVHHDVDALLNEAQMLIENEKEQAKIAAGGGKPMLSMPLNDLSRESAKYREALAKANDSNEALHRAMTAHLTNLKILGQPLAEVDKHIPKVTLPDPTNEGPLLAELRRLIGKVDEMRQQRMQLLEGLREAARADDITARLVTRAPRTDLDKLFDTELAKHQPQLDLIQQNLSAQQNILLALTDAYAKLSTARKHVVESFRRRDQVVSALISSYDAYDDLLAKANKGIDFYQKLETNVTKLLQRLRSTCRVQEEEREQKAAKQTIKEPDPIPTTITTTPKLRDYLNQPGVRPAPLGSEQTDPKLDYNRRVSTGTIPYGNPHHQYHQYSNAGSPHFDSANAVYSNNTNPTIPITETGQTGMQNMYPSPGVVTTPYVQPTNVSQSQYPSPNTYGYPTHPQPKTNPQASPYNYMSAGGQYYNQNPAATASNQVPQPVSQVAQTTTSYVPNQMSYVHATFSTQQPVYPNTHSPIYSNANAYSLPAKSQYSMSNSFPIPHTSQNVYNTYNTLQSQYNSQTPNVNPVPTHGSYSAPQSPYNNSQNTLNIAQQNSYGNPKISNMSQNPYSSTQTANVSTNSTRNAFTSNQSHSGSQAVYSTPYNVPQNYNQPYNTSQQYNPQIPPQITYPQKGTYAPNASSQSSPSIPQYQQNQAYYTTATSITPYPTAVYSNAQSVPYSGQYQMNQQTILPNPQTIVPNQQTIPQNQHMTVPNQQILPNQQMTLPNQQVGVPNHQPGVQNRHPVVPNSQMMLNQQRVVLDQSIVVNQTSSNIDLLSGLDFNVTQVPLDPVKAPVSPPPAVEERTIDTTAAKPPIEDPEPYVQQFEVELQKIEQIDMDKYEHNVQILESWMSSSFDFEIEKRWKELQQRQERDCSTFSISVARCYPARNRCPDSLPYDKNRVELPTPPATDDYINASVIPASLRGRPAIVITQAPTAANMTDFWTMVSHRKCESIVCLASDAELMEVGLTHGYLDPDFGIQIRGEKVNQYWVERTLGTVGGKEIVHYQLTTPWPTIEGQTVIVTALADLALELTGLNRRSGDVIVHCLTGQGRSGVFSALLMAASDVKTGPRLVDFQNIVAELAASRKNPLRDRLHLAIAYRALLLIAKSILPEPPITTPPIVETKEEPMETQTKDPFGDIDPLWKLKI